MAKDFDPSIGEATQFQPGQSGNPAGKPKGTKHLSTWIQDILNDEDFEVYLQHPTKGWEEFKGAPVEAIITVAVRKALNGDTRAMEWLAKHGYGEKINVEINDPRKEILKKYMGAESARQTQENESQSSEDSA